MNNIKSLILFFLISTIFIIAYNANKYRVNVTNRSSINGTSLNGTSLNGTYLNVTSLNKRVLKNDIFRSVMNSVYEKHSYKREWGFNDSMETCGSNCCFINCTQEFEPQNISDVVILVPDSDCATQCNLYANNETLLISYSYSLPLLSLSVNYCYNSTCTYDAGCIFDCPILANELTLVCCSPNSQISMFVAYNIYSSPSLILDSYVCPN